MYPSNLSTNLRRCEGAYVQTSLSRTFVHNRQTGLSLVARSTFSSKNFFFVCHSERFARITALKGILGSGAFWFMTF
jgi:hypothetical protein